MVRTSDQHWKYAEKTDDDGWKCKFCGLKFAAKTSISRIKSHLSGLKGLGTQTCKEVPNDVKEAARRCLAKQRSSKERPRKRPKPLSIPRYAEVISFSTSQGINDEVENHGRNVDGLRIEAQSIDEEMGEKRAPLLTDVRNYSIEDVSTGDDNELNKEGSFAQNCLPDKRETRGDKLLTSKVVGQAFERNMEKIWSWLMDDDVLRIGIYGMAGVGKTELARHVHNKLLEIPNPFNHVFWITASQDSSILKLQDAVAKTMHVDLSNEDEENKRAVKLLEAFDRREKSVIFFNDVWQYIPAGEVGIPVGANACKLVLTTRSLDVCRMTCCQKNIKVEPLLDAEGWELFMAELEHEITIPLEVVGIASSLAKRCGGLPFGIKTIARNTRGSVEVCEWRNALEDMEASIPWQGSNQVFQELKLSYDNLNDSALQQLFLYCALYPEDFGIQREDLIEHLIVEGIIKGIQTRQAELDKGHSLLNRLENVCLLESTRDILVGRQVNMHLLIRDFALQILREKSSTLIEAGNELKEWPDEEKWTEDLVRVSLMKGDIKEIPCSPLPMRPNISTLLLCSNKGLELIEDSFFRKLPRLEVLDLSNTAIRNLPDSVSELVSLTALFLKRCTDLKYVPSLAKLVALRKLDLSYTGLDDVPHGIQFLCKLRYLNFYGTRLNTFPDGILNKLCHLQFLRFYWETQSPITVKASEVARLTKLETLECHFRHLIDFKQYLESREKMQLLSTYNFLVGEPDEDELIQTVFSSYALKLDTSKRVFLCNCSISKQRQILIFPKDIQELVIVRCHDARSLCDVSSLIYATELQSLVIGQCDGIYCLFSSSCFSSSHGNQQHHGLISRREAAPLIISPSSGMFSRLEKIVIIECPTVKKLFPPYLLSNLQNLEVIVVRSCYKLEEIIAAEEQVDAEKISTSNVSNSSNNIVNSAEFTLPKLRTLVLECLPELKSICCGKLICYSLEEISVLDCCKLKRMPLPFLYSLARIWVRPRKWWDSVEWDPSNNENYLLRRRIILHSPLLAPEEEY